MHRAAEGMLLPKTQILILTAVEDDELVFMALQAGADGYSAEAHQAGGFAGGAAGGAGRRRAHDQRRSPGAWWNRSAPRRKSPKPAVHLSAREEEVLILLSKGYSNKEIADQLSISVETVGSHLKHIYEKMHVRSRAEAVARYMTDKP